MSCLIRGWGASLSQMHVFIKLLILRKFDVCQDLTSPLGFCSKGWKLYLREWKIPTIQSYTSSFFYYLNIFFIIKYFFKYIWESGKSTINNAQFQVIFFSYSILTLQLCYCTKIFDDGLLFFDCNKRLEYFDLLNHREYFRPQDRIKHWYS